MLIYIGLNNITYYIYNIIYNIINLINKLQTIILLIIFCFNLNFLKDITNVSTLCVINVYLFNIKIICIREIRNNIKLSKKY